MRLKLETIWYILLLEIYIQLYLKLFLFSKGDFNVMVIDWSHGNGPDYNQAVTNTFIVGAEIAYLVNYLHSHYSLNLADVHIIGHSLGAQIAGHIGTRAHTIGRISGTLFCDLIQ